MKKQSLAHFKLNYHDDKHLERTRALRFRAHKQLSGCAGTHPVSQQKQACMSANLLPGLCTGILLWPDSRMDSSVASSSTASTLSMNTCPAKQVVNLKPVPTNCHISKHVCGRFAGMYP